MFRILFTVDYEIHGNGEGSPVDLLLEPTDRTLKLFDRYGAKLTIMADAAEIMKFKEYKEKQGRDDYCYDAIVEQLQRAVTTGHDVQLHIHASYFNARFNDGKWDQDYSQYNLARLPADTIRDYIGRSKQLLEDIIRPVKPDYRCFAFRSACWSMNPTRNIAHALREHGFTIDTSVFKYGGRNNPAVYFDYTDAHHDVIPWQFDVDDVCRVSHESGLYEFPIYCEKARLWRFMSLNRIFRAVLSRQHNIDPQLFSVKDNTGVTHHQPSAAKRLISLLTNKHALKMDYNQCSGRQLIRMLEEVTKKYGGMDMDLPVVLIGHSKVFSRLNALSLRPFLAYAKERPDKYSFGVFEDFDVHRYGMNQG